MRWLTMLLAPVLVAGVPSNPTFDSLLRLRGDRAQVRYSAGALDRAANVQRRFEVLAALFEGAAGRQARRGGAQMALVVAAPEDWAGVGGTLPFGLVERRGSELLLPAWGDERTVRLWRDLTGLDPATPEGLPVRGTPEEAASLGFADLLAQVEGARYLVDSSGARFSSSWLREVCVHAVALAAFERHEPARIAGVRAFFAALAARQAGALLEVPGGFSSATDLSSLSLAGRLAAEGRYFALADGLAKGKARPVAEWLLELARRPAGVTAKDAIKRWPEIAVALRAFDAPARP